MKSSKSQASRPDTALGRRVLGATLFVCGGALIAGPAIAGSAVAETPTSAITVTQTPYETQGECLPGATALSNTVGGDSSTFVLRVTASAPLCDPIEAVAAVYAMPGGGVAWPQTLRETKKFTLKDAGVTEIVFAKTCAAVQFDVLTGATPNVISPDGEWHGPLLFPLDTNTALQFEGTGGEACIQASSTIAPTTAVTTTTVAQTTTTVPSNVLTETTVRQATTTTAAVSVLAETQNNSNALAVTGNTSGGMALVGAGLLVGGIGLMATSRRGQLA